MKKLITTEATVTRRDFLKGAAYGTLGMTLGIRTVAGIAGEDRKAVPFSAEKPISKVVLIRNLAAVDDKNMINEKVVAEMIDSALMALIDENDEMTAWQKFIKPDDTVGVKFTRCDWMRIHTEEAVVKAIQKRISNVKVPAAQIKANDYGLPIEQCNVLINVPSVKVHTLTGIAAALKNYINFSDKPSAYHHEGSTKLGEIWHKPGVKGKTKLIIVDLLRPYFGPGPQINPLHRWNYNGILVATDPVAIDTICVKICQEKRNLFKGEEWPINPPPKSIEAADTKYGLGTSDPLKIKLIRLGWEQDSLI